MKPLKAERLAEEEAARVESAVQGIEPDFELIRPMPAKPEDARDCAQDMVRSLLALGAEFYRLTPEPDRIVVQGWRIAPLIQARYVSPPRVETKASFSMDLRPADRARLRNIVRRTHRWAWRDEPTTAMVDELIDSLGPQVAGALVKKARDGHLVG